MKAVKVIKRRLLEADNSDATSVVFNNTDDIISNFNSKIDIFNGYTRDSLSKTLDKVKQLSQSAIMKADANTELNDLSSASTGTTANQVPKELTIDDVNSAIEGIKSDINGITVRLNGSDSAKAIKNGQESQQKANDVKKILRIALDRLKLRTKLLKDSKYDKLEQDIEDFIKPTNSEIVNVNIDNKEINSVEAVEYIITILNAIKTELEKIKNNLGYDALEASEKGPTKATIKNNGTPTTSSDVLTTTIDELSDSLNTKVPDYFDSLAKKLAGFNKTLNKNKTIIDTILKSNNVLLTKELSKIFNNNNILDNLQKNVIIDKEADKITSTDLASLRQTIISINDNSTAIHNVAADGGYADNVITKIEELIKRVNGASKNKAVRDWRQLFIEASKNGTVELTAGINNVTKRYDLKGLWDLYYQEEWTNKFGPGVGEKVRRLGSSFINELTVLGFNADTNPFIGFVQLIFSNNTVAGNPDLPLTAVSALNYSAVHNAYIDRNITVNDLHGQGINGMSNLIFKQALYNVAAQDAEKYLELQKTCYAVAKDNKYTIDLLRENYENNPGAFLYAAFFETGDPLTLTAPTSTAKLKKLEDVKALIKECFGLEDEEERGEFSLDNAVIKDFIANGNPKDNAIALIKYIIAAYNHMDRAQEIFDKYSIKNTTIDLSNPVNKKLARDLKNLDLKAGTFDKVIAGVAKLGGLI